MKDAKGPNGPKWKGAYPAYLTMHKNPVNPVSSVFGAKGGWEAGKAFNEPSEPAPAKKTPKKSSSKKPLKPFN
jgi:hypothetical protein